MELKRVITSFFSPTGGTKKVAMALQEGFLDGIEQLDPNVMSYNCLTPLQRSQKVPEFDEHDLLVFCYPVFAGRLPLPLQTWPELKGNGASAVIVSVYGNRAIDDAGRETMAMLEDHGFKVIGHIEALAEHSMDRSIGAGRPNDEDKAKLHGIALDLLKLCHTSFTSNTEIPQLSFDRTTPLKPMNKTVCVPEPQDDAKCEQCGRCALLCPMGIIDAATLRVLPENQDKCIGCRACIVSCRSGMRDYSPEYKEAVAKKMQMMKAANPDPKPIVFTLA